MREETLIEAVNDIDTIARLTEDLYDKYYNNEPDYWEKLKHQYAGMAMQQMVNIVNEGYEYVYEETAIIALNFATALVNRLKEEEK